MARRWWRVLQAVAGLAIVGFAIRFLARNWEAVRQAPLEWRFRPLWLIASVVLVLATYGLLAEAWRRMVAGWARSLSRTEAARIWVLSSMGKYLPGKLWAIAGLAMMGQRAGVPPGVSTASAVALQVLSIGTGAAVIGLTGLARLEAFHPGSAVALAALVAVAGLAILALARPRLLNRILARVIGPGRVELTAPPASALAFGTLANALAWVLYGVALYWLAGGALADSRLDLETAIAAFTGSYLAGFLFLLAPGGLGVRESVFVLLTQSSIGPTQALALAALSRVAMTAADLLAALPFVLFRGSPRASA